MRWNAFRRGLQTVHLWAGLVLSLPFIVIGISGSILMLLAAQPQWSRPAAPARGAAQPLAQLIKAAIPAAPAGLIPNGVTLPGKPGEAAGVDFTQPPEQQRGGGFRFNQGGPTIFVDPVSLKILGSAERRRADAFNRNLHTLHEALMVPQYYGFQTVGFLGLGMVLFGLSGLVLWWPRSGQWGSAFGIKRGARGFRLHRDLHSAIGVWTLVFFLILSVSGVDLVFPLSFEAAVQTLFSTQDAPVESVASPAALAAIAGRGPLSSGPVGPDIAVKLALAAVPRAHAVAVQLPAGDHGIYMVSMEPDGYSDDAPQILAFVGPGVRVSDIVDPRRSGFGGRLLAWLRVLHYGHGLGLVYWVLIFLSGFLPLLFAVTGVSMWWLKRVQRRVIPEAFPVAAE